MSPAHLQDLPSKQAHYKKNQSGVVLFIAMVALVVMSLAAVALIRSVDTNSLIAGNLSYKQTAAISSSYGLENMADTLGIQLLAYGEIDDAANGYYATCKKTFVPSVTADDRCDGENLTVDDSWVPGTTSRLADGGATGITGGVDAYGNTIQYIVERMCSQTGVPTKAACLLATSNKDNGSRNVCSADKCITVETLADLPVYRVTVRVAGPKNTVSYIQAFIS